MPSASQHSTMPLKLLRRGHRAGRVGGARDQHAGERRLAMRRFDVLGGERPARVRADRDLHRDQAERLQDVAVGRIGRRGHGDAVARIEGAEEDQIEAAGGAGRHHHARGREVDAVGFAVVAGDPLAQRPDAERLGVAEPALQRLGGRARARASAPARPAGRPPCGRCCGRPLPARLPRPARPSPGTARHRSVAEAFSHPRST